MAGLPQTQEAEPRAFLPPTATATTDDLMPLPPPSRTPGGFGVLDEVDRAPGAGEGLDASSDAADQSGASPAIGDATMTRRAESIVGSLYARLGGECDRAELAQQVDAEIAALSGARVTQFISILVERRVWERFSSSNPRRAGPKGL